MFSHAREGGNYLRSYYGLGLFDPFYADYYSAPAYSSASPPPVIVIQAPAAPAPISASAPMQPLLIELKGDQYVRVSEETQPPQSVEELPASGMLRKPSMNASVSSTPASNIAALLVFRDGHQEQVGGYTIAGGALYVSTDYYSAGTWNRKVDLSSLDIPATIKSNVTRGVQFRLPSAANEVIVGP
jgi:hypothetical protein